MTDLDSSNGASYQGMVSYPIVGTDGNLKVVCFKSLQGNFNSENDL
jgi:hypothetical protein